jgi:hypothetical protein
LHDRCQESKNDKWKLRAAQIEANLCTWLGPEVSAWHDEVAISAAATHARNTGKNERPEAKFNLGKPRS